MFCVVGRQQVNFVAYSAALLSLHAESNFQSQKVTTWTIDEYKKDSDSDLTIGNDFFRLFANNRAVILVYFV